MTVLVVGGGIVGMVASFLMAARSKEVILVENAPHLGGLLRGPNFDGRYFDHGTHLLASTGIPEIDDFMLSDLSKESFNLFKGHDADRAGCFSLAGWNEDSSFPDIRFEGIAEDVIEWRNSNESCQRIRSAKEQLLSLYGKKAAPFFEQILSSVFGMDSNELGANAVKLLALHRAVLMSNQDIKDCLNLEKLGPVIAHPDRSLFNQRTPPDSRSLYPRSRGLGQAIDKLEAKLERAGVKVLKSAKLERSDGNFIAKTQNGAHTILSPNVLWTAGIPSAANLFLKKKFETFQGDLVCWIAHVELNKKARKLSNYYYFVRHPKLRTYRLTNYSALTGHDSDQAYTLEITVPKTISEADMAELVKVELHAMGLIESVSDLNFLRMNRLNYSFLNTTVEFDTWCESIEKELRQEIQMFGPWSSSGMFFTGDCLRDLYRRLPS